MFRLTSPLLRNFPLAHTAGSTLKKVHLPHQLPSDARAEVIFEASINPQDPKTQAIYDTHPVPGPEPPVEFGNRIKRKHQDHGAGRHDTTPILCINLFTLLDTQPLVKALGAEIGQDVSAEKLERVVELWTGLLVQYTWRLNAMDTYRPLPPLMPHALRSALTHHNLHTTLPSTTLTNLIKAFTTLPTHPFIPAFLSSLASNTHFPSLAKNTYLHSPFPLSIMNSLVSSNPSTLAEFFYHPGRIRSVDVDTTQGSKGGVLKRYMPHPLAYSRFTEEVGVQPREVVFITAQEEDVVGAKRAGWRVVWVDWKKEGWWDGLGRGLGMGPDWRVEGLDGMRGVIEEL